SRERDRLAGRHRGRRRGQQDGRRGEHLLGQRVGGDFGRVVGVAGVDGRHPVRPDGQGRGGVHGGRAVERLGHHLVVKGEGHEARRRQDPRAGDGGGEGDRLAGRRGVGRRGQRGGGDVLPHCDEDRGAERGRLGRRLAVYHGGEAVVLDLEEVRPRC